MWYDLAEVILMTLFFGAVAVGIVGLVIWALVKSELARIAGVAFVAMWMLFGVYMVANAEPVVQGNIDLDNRPVVVWEDGSFSTELSISVEFDGLEVLLPTIINGKPISVEEAIEHYFETGEHLGKFSSIEECEAYAVELHLRQQECYGQGE